MSKFRKEKSSGSRFQYEKRDPTSVEKRQVQQGMFDNPIKDGVPFFKPEKGDHTIRILPPTWKKAEHYGLDIFMHYGVGTDNGRFLCLDKMKGEPCPICEARDKVRDDEEYAKKLRPTRRVAVYVIDRDEEKAGPKLWLMPQTFDMELATLSQNKRTKAVLLIDDPEEGYDVEFTVKGTGINTEYTGIQVGRSPTPLADDEDTMNGWLDHIQDSPIPECLKYYPYKLISKTFGGVATPAEDEDDVPRTRKDRSRREVDEDEEDVKPRRKRPADDEDDIDDEDEDLDDEKPAKKRRPTEDDEDEEDVKPHRKRPADEEDEYDEDVKPRRKRPADEDEDDDRPARKRRPADEDDEDEEDVKPRRKRPRVDEDEDD